MRRAAWIGRRAVKILCNIRKHVSLVPSLLQAIVRVSGEALVMHAGDKPYIVAPVGQIELANSALALDVVSGIIAQLLPAELERALDECGSVQYDLPPQAGLPREHFTVVVARGGDEVWAEIRRHRVVEESLCEGAAAQVQAEPSTEQPPAPGDRIRDLEEQAAALRSELDQVRSSVKDIEERLALAQLQEPGPTKEQPLDTLNTFGELLIKTKLDTFAERLRALHDKVAQVDALAKKTSGQIAGLTHDHQDLEAFAERMAAMAARATELEAQLSHIAARLPSIEPPGARPA